VFQTSTNIAHSFVSDLDTVRLVIADVDLITAIAGSDAVRKLDGLHDAELVQDGSRLLTEHNDALDLALNHDHVAEAVDGHTTRILQNV